MKKNARLVIAAAVLAALVALKLLFPDAAALIRGRASDALAPDRDYRAVFGELGERLSMGRAAAPPEEARETEAPASAGTPRAAALIQPQEVRYRIEEAATLGERVPQPAAVEMAAEPEPEPAPEVPAAVSAFLESQSGFLDSYALPENVDYAYTEFPFAYALPVSGCNSSGFGYRTHPILNEIKFHFGTDIAANSGEDILAFADGTVTFAGTGDGYGNYITIDHGEGWTSLYAHCSRLWVSAGQTVKAGEKIALVGATGRVTGPHLHFELRRDGVYVNPEYYING